MFGDTSHGSATYAADSVIGSSGAPTRIYSVTWTAGAGGAGEVVIRAGSTASGTIIYQKDGSLASHSDVQSWEGGLLFPTGAFWDKDANTDIAVFEFRTEL